MSPSFLPPGLGYFPVVSLGGCGPLRQGREGVGLSTWVCEMRYGVVVWRWFGMDGWWMDMDGVVVNVLKTRYYYYITNVIYFSCAKDANHSQILGSPDPLFIFSTKAHRCWPWPAHIWRCADFLLLRDADFRRIRRSRAYAQVWFGDGIYAALRQLWWCPWRRSLHSIVFR